MFVSKGMESNNLHSHVPIESFDSHMVNSQCYKCQKVFKYLINGAFEYVCICNH